MRTHTILRVHRCGVHAYAPSWLAGIGTCTCVHALCRAEDDGFHEHEIRVGDDAWSRIVVQEQLHAWMADSHYPEGYVSVQVLRDYQHVGNDLAAAWRTVAEQHGLSPDVPDFPCRIETATEVPVGA
ncbi:hypothetical protein [Actinoplanes sp. URMC 104]|uniref:hypothetical protein n=1 Tax=Actinoplanes sp. URMC 104 TaxID=3423409 RepID=UPI003F1BCF8B